MLPRPKRTTAKRTFLVDADLPAVPGGVNRLTMCWSVIGRGCASAATARSKAGRPSKTISLSRARTLLRRDVVLQSAYNRIWPIDCAFRDLGTFQKLSRLREARLWRGTHKARPRLFDASGRRRETGDAQGPSNGSTRPRDMGSSSRPSARRTCSSDICAVERAGLTTLNENQVVEYGKSRQAVCGKSEADGIFVLDRLQEALRPRDKRRWRPARPGNCRSPHCRQSCKSRPPAARPPSRAVAARRDRCGARPRGCAPKASPRCRDR
jgi:hypothetical protein